MTTIELDSLKHKIGHLVLNVSIHVEAWFEGASHDVQDIQVVFCVETTTNYHGRFPTRPKSVVLNVEHTLLDFLLLPPVLHRRLLPSRINRNLTNIGTFTAHSLCFFEVFNDPVDNVSRRCDKKRNLWMILSLNSNTRTTPSAR
jgi:hypothetical protein